MSRISLLLSKGVDSTAFSWITAILVDLSTPQLVNWTFSLLTGRTSGILRNCDTPIAGQTSGYSSDGQAGQCESVDDLTPQLHSLPQTVSGWHRILPCLFWAFFNVPRLPPAIETSCARTKPSPPHYYGYSRVARSDISQGCQDSVLLRASCRTTSSNAQPRVPLRACLVNGRSFADLLQPQILLGATSTADAPDAH
jgi:hypothetical protein